MSLINDGNGMYMPVAPAYAGGNGMNGFGCGDGWWVILFLFALMGNNGFGGWGGNGDVLPYLWNQNTNDSVNSRFDAAGLSNQISSLQSTVAGGFADAEIANCGRAMTAMQTAHQAEITGLQQSFAMQSQLANCCCENRQSIASQSLSLVQISLVKLVLIVRLLQMVFRESLIRCATTRSTQRTRRFLSFRTSSTLQILELRRSTRQLSFWLIMLSRRLLLSSILILHLYLLM